MLYRKGFAELFILFSELVKRYLDEEFTKIRELQDDSCPDFVIKVANVFFKDCQRIICDMDIALRVQVVDFKKIIEKVHQLKGSSSSFGAARVHEVCIKLRPLCESKNRDGCIRCLHELHNEAAELQNKLHLLFWYEQRFINAGGTFSKVE
ncbi:Histidine-containing phosphotransfer protein 5 [Linum grandiflorum]